MQLCNYVTPATPWVALELIEGAAAVPWIWRRHLDQQFDAFAKAFLQRAARAVRIYPCPRGCGCAHEVLRSEAGQLTGVCRCESWNCDDLPLMPEDVMPLELNWPKLSRALAGVLNLETKAARFNLCATRQIGSWSAEAVPVILTIQNTPAAFRRIVLELAARMRQPFILWSPTAAQLDATSQELLGQVGAGFFSLEAHVSLNLSGSLHLTRAPGELFARFTAQPGKPLDEDLARRAFALVQQLDSGHDVKPPSVLSVFHAYCLDELNAMQTARKLRCSKTTVLRRLELLRNKTGLEPQALRRFSPHLSKIEEDFDDSRAKHIHRRNLIDEEEEE